MCVGENGRGQQHLLFFFFFVRVLGWCFVLFFCFYLNRGRSVGRSGVVVIIQGFRKEVAPFLGGGASNKIRNSWHSLVRLKCTQPFWKADTATKRMIKRGVKKYNPPRAMRARSSTKQDGAAPV